MNSKAIVSIIIPIKDRFEWFNDCLQSIINQTYSPMQIIIIDDASVTPVRNYLEQNWPEISLEITIIRNNKSFGPGVCREQGRKVVEGSFISYLDSDDVIHKDKIQKQVEFLQNHPDFGMCFCKAKIFSELPITGHEKDWRPGQITSDQILPQLLINRLWGTSCCLWTRKTTDMIGDWSTLRAGEDQEYEFRAGLLQTKIYQQPETLCYIRRSNELPQLNQENKDCRMEDANIYISIAELAKPNLDKVDRITKFMLARHLIFSTFFLLSEKLRGMAKSSMKSVQSLYSNHMFAKLLISLQIWLIDIFPSRLAGSILFFFRHRTIRILRIAG